MTKKIASKSSKRNNADKIGTLDHFFTRKKPTGEHQSPTKNENYKTNDASPKDANQQKETIPAMEDAMNGTNQQRTPFTELNAMDTGTNSTTRRQTPKKPSFVVLQDNSSHDQGGMKAQQQQQQQQDQQHDIDTLTASQSQFNTQTVPLVDTLDSRLSVTSSPMALDDSQCSFSSPSGIEFCVDSLDLGNSNDGYGSDNSHFFDDLEQLQMKDSYNGRQAQWPMPSGINGYKRTHQLSFDSDDENEGNKDISTQQTDISSLELFNPLLFSYESTGINNRNSSYDNDAIDSPSQTNSGTLSSLQRQPTSSSYSFLSSYSPSLQHNSSSLDSSDLLPTLPMSPLPLDQSLDLHVAYPVPRGTHILDKFGQ